MKRNPLTPEERSILELIERVGIRGVQVETRKQGQRVVGFVREGDRWPLRTCPGTRADLIRLRHLGLVMRHKSDVMHCTSYHRTTTGPITPDMPGSESPKDEPSPALAASQALARVRARAKRKRARLS